MIKSKDKKTNPLDQVTKRIEKYIETYDNPLVHDPLTNSFKTENQMKLEAEIKEQKDKMEDMAVEFGEVRRASSNATQRTIARQPHYTLTLPGCAPHTFRQADFSSTRGCLADAEGDA